MTRSSGKGQTFEFTKDPVGTARIVRTISSLKDEDVADGFSSNPSTCQKDVMPK